MDSYSIDHATNQLINQQPHTSLFAILTTHFATLPSYPRGGKNAVPEGCPIAKVGQQT